MTRYSVLMLAVLISFSNCFADTFTHRSTGETFNGYVVKIKKGDRTQVRAEKSTPKYLDLSDYEIQQNYLGRKDKVFKFCFHDSIDLVCETQAFEKALAASANQGPLFILIEIDTPGGKFDLANRICAAITSVDNCLTVAFVPAGKSGGAYSAGAMIALACDRLYIADKAAIGGGTQPASARLDPQRAAVLPYIASLAQRNNRPAVVVRAMLDERIQLAEIKEAEKTSFVDLAKRRSRQTIVRTWSEKGSFLRLTADEAVHCNIADGIALSTDNLFELLDAPKVRIVQNKDCLKAKRKFQKAQKDFDKILPAIPVIERRADELLRQLDNLEQRIHHQKVLVEEYKTRRRWYGRRLPHRSEEDALKEMQKQHKRLVKQSSSALKDLNAKYKGAVRMANEHPDLNADLDALNKGMVAATTKYDQFLKRPGI
ncbi:MAG: hypothetical protein JSW23_03900 [Planctomycetota bacterium]|nr:MAG: hypothetical protein JSW23_03900 [Planctomycetota bacterium]